MHTCKKCDRVLTVLAKKKAIDYSCSFVAVSRAASDEGTSSTATGT